MTLRRLALCLLVAVSMAATGALGAPSHPPPPHSSKSPPSKSTPAKASPDGPSHETPSPSTTSKSPAPKPSSAPKPSPTQKSPAPKSPTPAAPKSPAPASKSPTPASSPKPKSPSPATKPPATKPPAAKPPVVKPPVVKPPVVKPSPTPSKRPPPPAPRRPPPPPPEAPVLLNCTLELRTGDALDFDDCAAVPDLGVSLNLYWSVLPPQTAGNGNSQLLVGLSGVTDSQGWFGLGFLGANATNATAVERGLAGLEALILQDCEGCTTGASLAAYKVSASGSLGRSSKLKLVDVVAGQSIGPGGDNWISGIGLVDIGSVLDTASELGFVFATGPLNSKGTPADLADPAGLTIAEVSL